MIENKIKQVYAWVMEMPLKRGILPLMILLAGVYARVWWIRTIPTEQLYDFDAYYRIAKNIFDGKGFTYEGEPIAFQGMFYSWSLGMMFKMLGTASIALAKWLNVVYSSLTVFLVWLIVLKFGKQLENGESLALFAMAITAFLPHHIAYCNTTGTETLMALLLAMLIYVQISVQHPVARIVLLGILTGICTLTKPFYLAYPIILGVSEWLMVKNFKKALVLGAAVWLIMAAVVSPWTLRNYKAFGRYIPVSYNSGFNLYINNNPNNIHGGWMSFEDLYKTPELEEKINKHLENGTRSIKLASNIELDFKPMAVKWIKENPTEFIKLGLIRIHSTYFNGSWDIDAWTMNQLAQKESNLTATEVGRNFNAFRALNDIFLGILSGFSILFILVGIPQIIHGIFSRKWSLSKDTVILFMNLAFPSMVFFVYEGQPRYNHSLLFLMIIVLVISADRISKLYKKNPINE